MEGAQPRNPSHTLSIECGTFWGVRRSGIPALMAAVLLLAGTAGALPFRVGLTGGATDVQNTGVSTGPTAGLFAELGIWDALSLSAAVDRSSQSLRLGNNASASTALDIVSLGATYRIDLTPIVPYGGFVGQYRRFHVAGFGTFTDTVGSLVVGVNVPLWSRFLVGAEMRYGVLGGAETVGTARQYLLRLGFGFGDDGR